MGMKKLADEPLQNRTVSVNTYPAENGNVIVEGELKDIRKEKVYLPSGEIRPPGTVHHMIIRWLVEPATMTISDVEVEMISHPRDECPETIESVNRVKGLSISTGFTARVKEMLGGVSGCAHLTTLLIAMAPAAIQGIYSYIAGQSELVSRSMVKAALVKGLSDTCYVWREGGPILEGLKMLIREQAEE